MIILDTHIFIWWVHDVKKLTSAQMKAIEENESSGLGISVISVWEIAKLFEYKKLTLPFPLEEWLEFALSYPGIQLLELTPKIIIESTKLPGNFHKDPADQIIVATAKVENRPLITSDQKIVAYEFIETIF